MKITILITVAQIMLIIMVAESIDALGNFLEQILETKIAKVVSSDPNDVRFYLFNNPTNLQKYHEIKLGDKTSIETSRFLKGKPVKIITHGFLGNFQTQSSREVKDAYLKHFHSVNIICVDWSKLSTPKLSIANILLYTLIESNVPIAGDRIGEFIYFLIENNYVELNQFHLIGFSLGAHVVSNAAKFIIDLAESKVGRISGLDPAKIFTFDVAKTNYKVLNYTDAEFVDVIHTNMAMLGQSGKSGHVDFYVNGGENQPGCLGELNFRDTIVLLGSLTEPISGSCSHFRAPYYFSKSINPRIIIPACKCNSWYDYVTSCGKSCSDKISFGDRCPKTARGNYYLEL